MMNTKSVTFYILYTAAAFFLFLWIAFPGQKAGEVLSGKLNSISEHLSVSINKVTPGIMLTCKIKQTEISINNKVKFALDSLKLSPHLLSIFSNMKKADFEIKKGKGVLKRTSIIFDATGNLTDIGSSQLKGNMSLSDVVIKTEDIPLLKSMEISSLIFSNINFEFKRHYDKIHIINFNAKGEQCNIKGKGTIFFLSKSDNILLKLETNIQPNASYLSKLSGFSSVKSLFDGSKDGIDLNIFGTLASPKIEL